MHRNDPDIRTSTKGGGNWMPGVIVRENEPFEKALRRFKKTCEKSGIMSDLRKHQHFEKPSERRKRKINSAKRRRFKEQMFRESL